MWIELNDGDLVNLDLIAFIRINRNVVHFFNYIGTIATAEEFDDEDGDGISKLAKKRHEQLKKMLVGEIDNNAMKDEHLVEKLSFSIEEFCVAHDISRATFYNLRKRDLAPRVMKVGKRTLISAESITEWRIKMEGK